MKILREKTTIALKREVITKMYNVACEVYEKFAPSHEGVMKDRHDVLLDVALKHWSAKPTGQVVYQWTNTQSLDNLIFKNSKR